MNPFDILYEKFRVFKKQNKFAQRTEIDLDALLEEFQKALGAYHKEVDRSNVISCLEAIQLLKGIHWARCTDEHLLAFLDFFTREELSVLFNVKLKTLHARVGNIQRKGKSIESSGGELTPAEIEFIKKMSPEDFERELELSSRVRQMAEVRKSGLPGVQVARDVLINKRNRQQKELEQMWALTKDFLAWVTGDFTPAAMKKFSTTKPPFDVKVLVSEILGEKYDELRRKYQEVKPKEETPWETMEKKAKRRGKFKPTRKIEEAESKRLKVAGSTAPTLTESAESPSTSASEEVAS